MENRIQLRRRLIKELMGDARKLEGESLKKRYTPCEYCGKEGCEAEHETESNAQEMHEESESPEKELTEEALAALLE